MEANYNGNKIIQTHTKHVHNNNTENQLMRKINAYEILLHIYDHTGYVCTIVLR